MSALHDSTNVVSPGGARKRQRVAGSFLDILEEAGVSFDDEGSSETTGASSGKRVACRARGRARRRHLAIEAPRSPREGAAPSLGVAQRVCASLPRMRSSSDRAAVTTSTSLPLLHLHLRPLRTHTPPTRRLRLLHTLRRRPSSSHLPSARSFTGLRTSHASLFASPRPRLQDGLAST